MIRKALGCNKGVFQDVKVRDLIGAIYSDSVPDKVDTVHRRGFSNWN